MVKTIESRGRRQTPGRTYAARVAAGADRPTPRPKRRWKTPSPRPEPATLGEFVRRRRRQLGLPMRTAAATAGVSPSTFCAIEFDQTTDPPRDATLTKMAAAIGVQPVELLAWAHLRRTPSDVLALLARLLGRPAVPSDLAEGREVAHG